MKSFTYESEDGEIRVWIEQGAVHVKIVDAHGDPVELTPDAARELASVLREYAEAADS
jgi:hypothetical protein